MKKPRDIVEDGVYLDPDRLAERMRHSNVPTLIARLLLRRARARLTAQPTPVPARSKP